MRVLIACEYSGAVRDAFTRLGHDAVSCDLLPSDAPGRHYQGDVRELLEGWEPMQFACECDPEGDGWCQVSDRDPSECGCLGPTMDEDEAEYREVGGVLLGRPIARPQWDLMIAHPPCTHLSVAGAKHFALKAIEQPTAQANALDFVRTLLAAPIRHIALENPVSIISTEIREPDQIVQPWMFGHEATKTTCLWLKSLPPLAPTNVVGKGARHVTKSGKSLPTWYNLPPSADRWKIRSATFAGFAWAMAEQWGALDPDADYGQLALF